MTLVIALQSIKKSIEMKYKENWGLSYILWIPNVMFITCCFSSILSWLFNSPPLDTSSHRFSLLPPLMYFRVVYESVMVDFLLQLMMAMMDGLDGEMDYWVFGYFLSVALFESLFRYGSKRFCSSTIKLWSIIHAVIGILTLGRSHSLHGITRSAIELVKHQILAHDPFKHPPWPSRNSSPLYPAYIKESWSPLANLGISHMKCLIKSLEILIDMKPSNKMAVKNVTVESSSDNGGSIR